jgi:hypothetical protein
LALVIAAASINRCHQGVVTAAPEMAFAAGDQKTICTPQPWPRLSAASSLWKTLRSNALQALGFGQSARGGGKGQVTLMAAVLQIMGIRAPEARNRNAKAALITALAAFASGASFAGSSLTLISRFQAQSLAASLPLGAASCSFTLVS